MNNKMTRTIRDKAEQYIRRDVRKWHKDLKAKKDNWMIASITEAVIIIILAVIILL